MQRVMYAAVSMAPMIPTMVKAQYPLRPDDNRISSLDQKPASGKIPASAADAMTKVVNVGGMYLRRPPMSFFMSKLWCEPEWLTDPAPRNRQALKKAWVNRWKIPPTQAPHARAMTM